jgi:gamma-glutamyltranspeptidase/glutathione hydrolase
VRPALAAGHPATVAAGVEALEDGGTAADAAVAMCLASCVAETVMTGLLGGGHAIWWDGRRAGNLDCFVAVPSSSAEMTHLPLAFGEDVVEYSVGAPSCGVPGVPAGLEALHRLGGALPLGRIAEPARRLAREGVSLTPRHALCLEMVAPAFAVGRGAELYAPAGRPLGAGELLVQPGLVDTIDCLVEEGFGSVYRGSIAEALLAVDGVVLDRADLRSYEARWHEPARVEWHGRHVLTRGGLSGLPELLGRLPQLGGRSEEERVLALVAALEAVPPPESETHTTNLVVIDEAGRACVLTTSLGLGAGVWTPHFDLHLNSMLGESDLVVGEPTPGERMESMMAPTLVLDEGGLTLAIGSAGGTRLRTALATVLAGILDEGLDPQDAVDRARIHPTSAAIHAEPGVDEHALGRLEAQGRTVRRWPDLHHYFGGVSCAGRSGAAGDPRRDGAAVELS